MASIATDMAKTILEKLMNNAIAESRYICCFTCIAEDLEKGKKALREKRETVEQRVKVANRRAEDIFREVISWQEQVDELIQEEDTETNMACCLGFCPNCKRRYSKGKEMADKIEEMKKLMERNIESVGLPRNLPDVEYHSLQGYIPFQSRELKYRELLNALTDENVYMVGLQGMGGTGKTTLAKKVGKELKQGQQFDHVIDTAVSYTPDVKKIQDDIAAPLGLKFENCSQSERHKLLWTRLTGGGAKILLILDDVWQHIDFEVIGIPYNDSQKGCKVLITTRDRLVCESMECNRIIQLDVLPEEDAWILFRKHAGITDSFSKSLLEKGRKIAKKCEGLPVAIAAIASSLKGKQQKEEWDVALQSLERKAMDGVDKSLASVYKCLSYSYDRLNNEKAKRLFLLCSLFREDEQISVETLTRFGIGIGLFGEDDHTYDDARSQVAVTVNELIYSCLLLNDKEGYVKMHDLVRDVALWIAKKEIQSISLSKNDKKLLVEGKQNIKYLLYECKDMDVFSCRIDGSKLEILVAYMELDRDVEVPNSFFENMKGLRVLYISEKNWPRKSLSLSHSIQPLANIRSLFLQRFKLGDISYIGTLHNLETLELCNCGMDELANEITKLEKLRLLRLEYCEIKKNDSIFEVIERCPSLQELYIIKASNLSDAAQRRNLPLLQRYVISIGCDYVNYSKSKYVNLSLIDVLFSKPTFTYLVQNAEFLALTDIKGEWRNLIPDIVSVDNSMKDLVELQLKRCSKLHCLVDTKQNVFSKLTTLRLEKMGELEELCSGPFPPDFLKSLEALRIDECCLLGSILFKSELNLCYLKSVSLRSCPKLISLFQWSTSRSLVSLNELRIRYCEELRNIVADEGRGEESGEEMVDGGDDIKPRASMFPNLKTIYIDNCPQLRFVFHFFCPGDFPKLENIFIDKCGELEYIFVQYKHELDDHHKVKSITLDSLKSIMLSDLPKFIDIFPQCDHSKDLSMKRSFSKDGSTCNSETESAPFKCNVLSWTHKYINKSKRTQIPLVSKDQPSDYSISSASNSNYLQLRKMAQCLSNQSQVLHCIKHIYLENISKIKSVFTLYDAPALLVETLFIKKCDELKHIIIDTGDERDDRKWGDIFPKLKDLSVEDCGELEYIFGCNQKYNDSILLRLTVLESLKLWRLESLMGICPKNYGIMVPTLKEFAIVECSHFIIKSIRDLLFQLEARELDDTSVKGLTNSVTFQHLKVLKIGRSKKLEAIICTSSLRSLPQLYLLAITDCKELKHIVEEDVDNHKISNVISLKTCFPKLRAIVVKKCNKLKCIFPAFMSGELPMLEFITVAEATMLEGVFKCQQGDHKIELPKLKFVMLVNLPSLCQEDVEWLTVKYRFVKGCPKLPPSLTSNYESINLTILLIREYYSIYSHIHFILCDIITEVQLYEINRMKSENRIEEVVEEVATTSGSQLTSSKELLNEQPKREPSLINEQQLLGESNTASIIPHRNDCLQETKDQDIQESVASKETLSMESETKNTSLEPLQKEHGDGPIATPSSSLVLSTTEPASTKNVDTQETCDDLVAALTKSHAPVSLDGDGSMGVSSILEDLFSNNDGTSKASLIASKSLLVPFQGNPSQMVDDSSFANVVTRELEQLISNKYLASENLFLLSGFLLKHPYVRLTDHTLSNRYKGYAYNCLAELLKFLQKHSVLDVLGPNHSEFVELLQDVRRCAFYKDWLDSIERRALFPGLQVSEDALQKLLDSKRTLTQQLEDLKHQVEESATQQEAQVRQARAALSSPLGY